MDAFTPAPALLGGALSGLAAVALLACDGRVAGVCGIGRGSLRSLVATITFMAAAMLTVGVARHVVGGSH